MIQQIIVIINSNTITNKTVCKIFYFSLLLFYYDSLLKQYSFTFVAIVLVFSVNTISITIAISSHLVTEVSATLFKCLLFSQIHVLGSKYNLFHTYDNFCIHIDMCYYFIFVLNYILYY